MSEFIEGLKRTVTNIEAAITANREAAANLDPRIDYGFVVVTAPGASFFGQRKDCTTFDYGRYCHEAKQFSRDAAERCAQSFINGKSDNAPEELTASVVTYEKGLELDLEALQGALNLANELIAAEDNK